MTETSQEVRLLFFGTFFHENTELTADLIQLKQPVKVTEIRVIPLGATVDLSTGAFQLGATNPSEFEVDFYYNDLQVPSKTTFELLQRFDFNDKAHIQLICDPSDDIITDGLLVRGIYSTVTLAVYGHSVDKVHIREVEVPKKETVLSPKSCISNSSPPSPVTESLEQVRIECNEETPTVDVMPVAPIPIEAESPPIASHAIPTITTRVNYDAVQTASAEEECGRVEEADEQEELIPESEAISENNNNESDMSDTEVTETNKSVDLIPEAMDTEEISDGEVFPSDNDQEEVEEADEDEEVCQSDSQEVAQKTVYIDPLIEEVEPISSPQEPTSDMEDSFMDESSEPGFEEIISDEEIDFPEYDYREWEENWAHKFSRPFNPFSDSFEVLPLKNTFLSVGLPVEKTLEECLALLLKKCRTWSQDQYNSSLSERWVEDMEKLLPFIPSAFSFISLHHGHQARSPSQNDLESTLMFWVDIGTNIKLAMEQPSLAFKIRHLKVGIKLVECVANIEGELSNVLVSTKLSHSPVIQDLNQDDEDEQGRIPAAQRQDTSVQHHLLDLLMTPHMSNSCKLLILRSLDSTISCKCGFDAFTSITTSTSCYQRLIEYSLDSSFSTRMSFSLRSLLNKLRLMEGLGNLQTFVSLLASNSYSSGTDSESRQQPDELDVLQDLRATATHITEYFSLPSKVLPAKAVVDLAAMSSSGHDPKVSFVRMLKEMRFLQMATVLINAKEEEVTSNAIHPITELLTILLGWEVGLVYLSNEASFTTILVKSLLQLDDDAASTGCLIAHCMEVMQCVDTLSTSSNSGVFTESRDLQHLQTAVSFLTTSVGRDAIIKTLSQGNFILPLLNSVWPPESESEPDEDQQQQQQRLSSELEVRRGYAIEIVDFFLRSNDSVEFLRKHGPKILRFMNISNEIGGEGKKLSKNLPFLKPILNPVVFTLDGLDALCEIVKSYKTNLLQSRNAGCNWGFPGDITTCFRIMLHLVNGNDDNDLTRALVFQTDELRIRVLKHDLAIAKIHCNDLLPAIIGILQKIADEFRQPVINSHVFVSSIGDALLGLLLPVVKVLRKCITQVVQVRKTEYRDTTAVSVLLQINRLMSFFPATAIGYAKSQEVASDVVGILLAFTIPAVKLGPETEDELNKSTWTAVVSEIIKFTLEEPSNFQAGLTLFSELLPLPLPIASKTDLTDETCEEAIRLRRLWSAYIHGLSSQMHEMIGILCTSTNPRLLHLLKRVCIQLADLSVSTCLVVCRAILDTYLTSLDAESDTQPPSESQPTVTQSSSFIKAWVDTAKTADERQYSSHTARVLGFLASLMNNCPVIKCGVMHVLKGTVKMDEKYCDVLSFMCSILLACPPTGLSSSHIQAQDNVVTIFQSLCDVEINMLVPMFGKRSKAFEPEFVLACSLPLKEHLFSMTSALVSYLASESKSPTMQVLEGALRTLEIIAETDYGFSVISMNFAKHHAILEKVALSVLPFINNFESFESSLPCIMSYLDFIKSITTSRTQQIGSFPLRRSKTAKKDLQALFNWTLESSDTASSDPPNDAKSDDAIVNDDKEREKPMDEGVAAAMRSPGGNHSLYQLKKMFEEQLRLFRESQQNSSSLESADLESALQIIDQLISQLTENSSPSMPPSEETACDYNLQCPEGLSELFNIRPVYVLVDRLGGCNNDNLPIFWLTSVPPAFEVDCDNEEADLMACDLEEVSKSHLNGFDISREIQNIAKSSDLQSSESASAVVKNGSPHQGFRGGNHHGRRPTHMHALNLLHRRSNFSNSMRGGRGMFSRGMMSSGGRNYDPFRSRPPNTSRPPSLHVDDFVAMEGGSNSISGGDSYNSRGRGGNRGGGSVGGGGMMNTFGQDRRRNVANVGRSGVTQGGNFFHGSNNKRHESSTPSARVVRGGRIFSTPNSDRWTADSRNSSSSSSSLPQQSYDRSGVGGNIRSINYDDKYRSSPVGVGSRTSSSISSPRSQPYPQQQQQQRSSSTSGTGGGGYREQGRQNNSGGSSAQNYSPRWRDRTSSKTFNNNNR